MNHIKILKRALNITVNYRILWVFGILLALTAGSGSGNGGSGNSSSSSTQTPPNFNWQNPFSGFPQVTPDVTNMWIGIAASLVCLILAIIVVGTIVRYVSETALIRMVDAHETSGEKQTLRQGFRLGWSRAAFKMFLVDLLVGLSFIVVFLVLLALAALPLLVWLSQNMPLQILGSVISAGLILLLIFAAFIIGLAVSLIILFARRVCALENMGVGASLRRGFAIVKQHLTDVVLMGVMMFGIDLLWVLVTIPVILAVIVVAALIAGLPALLVGSIASIFTQGVTPWIVAAVVAAPIFLILVILPGALIGGWKQVFTSSAWTLTYREALVLEQGQVNDSLPAPDEAVEGE